MRAAESRRPAARKTAKKVAKKATAQRSATKKATAKKSAVKAKATVPAWRRKIQYLMKENQACTDQRRAVNVYMRRFKTFRAAFDGLAARDESTVYDGYTAYTSHQWLRELAGYLGISMYRKLKATRSEKERLGNRWPYENLDHNNGMGYASSLDLAFLVKNVPFDEFNNKLKAVRLPA